jgi:CBS domain-containing protein
MQQISEIMTRNVLTISPDENIRRAAQLMVELNIGALPVCDHDELIGIVTDRDITVRATSTNDIPENTPVKNVMSTDIHWCFDNQPVNEVMDQMRDAQIRRIPVKDHDTQKLVGIVSLGDVATKHSAEVDRTLEEISTPSQPNRPQSPS